MQETSNKYLEISEPPISSIEQIAASRQEMYGAFELFHAHVKHTISLQLSVITVLFAVLGFLLKGNPANSGFSLENIQLIKNIAGLLFILLLPMALVSSKIICRYFQVYVAALLFAKHIHNEHKIYFHPWLEVEGFSIPNDTQKLKRDMECKAKDKELSCFHYLVLIMLIGFAGFSIGAYILIGN